MKSIEQINLENKYIVINGGFGLIGSEIAERCLQSGAQLLIIDNNKKKLSLIKKKFSTFKDNFKILIVDSASKNSLKKIILTIKNFNNFNTFINCSYPRDKNWNNNTFKSKNISSFTKNLETNFISNVWLTKEIAEIMKKNNRLSSIILFSSIYGMVGQDLEIYNNSNIKENICYSVIKGGILNYTRLMASYYGKHKIRVNSISPGGVINKENNPQNKNFIKNYSKRVPIKRIAKSSEIANAVLFLCSDLSSYMNGSNLVVDGGWTAI